jgi:exodeoxyribonuclease VII large subunit
MNRPISPPATDSVFSVAQLTQKLAGLLRTSLGDVWVSGEVSNYSKSSSGHAYLTLKDDAAQIRAVIWRATSASIPFNVTDGLEVLAHGSIEVYAARGQYQLTIRQLIPKGIGALELAFRQLRDKLDREGLFDSDRKRPIPKFPKRVALVTSPRGAAVRDFLEVAHRRWRGIETIVIPCVVQGDAATQEIVSALEAAQRLTSVDAIALVRGGGSLEDLASFNSEPVARAIFRSLVPVVTGVGHEIDLTIADLVADVRALTPSEAAERIFPDASKLKQECSLWSDRLVQGIRQSTDRRRGLVTRLEESRTFLYPQQQTREWARQIDDIERSLVDRMMLYVKSDREKLVGLAGPLDSLSPLKSLARGYLLATKPGGSTLVRSSHELLPGDRIDIRLIDGRVMAEIKEVDVDGGHAEQL